MERKIVAVYITHWGQEDFHDGATIAYHDESMALSVAMQWRLLGRYVAMTMLDADGSVECWVTRIDADGRAFFEQYLVIPSLWRRVKTALRRFLHGREF